MSVAAEWRTYWKQADFKQRQLGSCYSNLPPKLDREREGGTELRYFSEDEKEGQIWLLNVIG